MGNEVVKAIKDGDFDVMVGLSKNGLIRTPLEKVLSENNTLDMEIVKLAGILS
jgi:6-phosphofructokinase 1